jgi:hypothetical protein
LAAYSQLALNVSHLLNNFVTFGIESDERHFQNCVVDLSSHQISSSNRVVQLCFELSKAAMLKDAGRLRRGAPQDIFRHLFAFMVKALMSQDR